MKKAPKRYNTGGGVYDDKDKLAKEAAAKEARKQAAIALAKKTGIPQPNPDYPTADEQMASKGHMNPTTVKQRASEAASMKVTDDDTMRVPKYDMKRNLIPLTSSRNPIPKRAKGGTVKKMTKAPCKMKKGGTC